MYKFVKFVGDLLKKMEDGILVEHLVDLYYNSV